MNIAEENATKIKSQRALELDELRKRGVAKSRRTKLKDLIASPLTTPEQAAQFLSAMRRDRNKKGGGGGWEHAAPPTNLSGAGVDAWYMMQKQREKEMRKRRKEAEQLLRGYRASYSGADDGSVFWSPSKKGGRVSLGDMDSECLHDPSESRRNSSMPRLENDWGEDAFSVGGHSGELERNPLNPERLSFLSERHHYDGTGYDKPHDPKAYNNGVSLFTYDGEPGLGYPEQRDPYGQGRAPGFNRDEYIDTTESEERLRELRERKSMDSRDRLTDDEEIRDGPNGYRDRGGGLLDQRDEERLLGVPREGAAFHRQGQGPNRQIQGGPREGQEAFVEQPPPRPETVWRDFISSEPGAKFPPEAGRYHLYASYACPGSHRALIVRALKGLENVVSVTIVHPTWRHTNLEDSSDKHRGWVFGDPNGEVFHNTSGRGGPFPAAYPGNDPDPLFKAYSIRELYEYADDNSGKYTIPLLWDKKLSTIVNNESSDISYMLNSCLNGFSPNPDLDLYTEDDEDGLDKLNEVSQWLYPMMIHGVYRCGFAKTQKAYDHAIEELTSAFDMAAELLQTQRYLTGDTLTDADIRLFVTLLRFDEVYAFYFRANTRLVMLTPTLLNFCREIYQMPGVAETCEMEQIKAHFFGSHAEWNKYSVIPRGLGFMEKMTEQHDRDKLEKREE